MREILKMEKVQMEYIIQITKIKNKEINQI